MTPTTKGGQAWSWFFSVLLFVLAVAAFLPALDNKFVDWDDRSNFLENSSFRGLGWSQVRWACTTYHLGVYQPFSWLALNMQYQAFGLDPRGYHLVSLILHGLVSVLTFVLVKKLIARAQPDLATRNPFGVTFGACWATAAFAVHPLRVEVVAWTSCQPYLVSALFAIPAVLAYLKAHPPDRPTHPVWLIASILLTLGAMLGKPAAVSLPAAFVILDFYPLRRLGFRPVRLFGPQARRVWLEKLPYFLLAAAFAILAYLAKKNSNVIDNSSWHRLSERVAQASYASLFYVTKTAWPTGLASFYPVPTRINWQDGPFLAAIVIVTSVSVILLILALYSPAPAAAWFAYLALTAPSLGLLRFSTQLAADRYCYFGMIPITALLAAATALITRPERHHRWRFIAIGLIGTGLIAAEMVLTWRQTKTWFDSETLARHAINGPARTSAETHNALGRALEQRGDATGAHFEYREALRLNPNFGDAHNSIGMTYFRNQNLDRALEEFTKAVKLSPELPAAHNNLGAVLGQLGRYDEAAIQFREALRLLPDFPDAAANLSRIPSVPRDRVRPR